jgi:hypothetical protein
MVSHLITKMLNAKLQQDLEAEFKPLGIVAYSNCCRLGCTGTYEEDDPDFKINEEGGIFFIRLHLNGMNYNSQPKAVYAQYENYDYLMQHWAAEEAKLDQWAAILGLQKGDYTINKPPNQHNAIEIKFEKQVQLEEPYDEDEDEAILSKLEEKLK